MSTLTVEVIATGRLKIDPSYQRELNEKRVQAMANQWSDRLADAITVSARNGSWYVIDGQHRLAAARLAGVGSMAAVVHVGLAPSEEAGLFADLNTLARRPTANQIFKARLEAGDESALSIRAACQQSGVTLDLANSGGMAKVPHVTRAVAALERAYEAGGARLVRQILLTLRTAWPEDHRALEATPIFGVGGFITTYERHPRYDFPRIARKLGEKSASVFIRRVTDLSQALREGGGNSGVQKIGPRSAVLEAYNRDMRGNGRFPQATLRDFRALAVGRNPWVDE